MYFVFKLINLTLFDPPMYSLFEIATGSPVYYFTDHFKLK